MVMEIEGNETNSLQPIEISNTQTAEEFLRTAAREFKIDEIISENAQVIFFGEEHNNYAVPLFLLERIAELKNAGITSVGFEILATEENKKLFEAINNGNLEAINQIDWSLGFGHQIVRKLKAEFVRRLVEAGIKIYPFRHYGEKEIPFEEGDEKTSQEIAQHIPQEGKTLILIGSGHIHDHTKRLTQYPTTADRVANLGYQIQRILFMGGMLQPGLYDRSTEFRLINAFAQLGLTTARCFNRAYFIARDFPQVDVVIIYPQKPFLSAQEPAPEKIS